LSYRKTQTSIQYFINQNSAHNLSNFHKNKPTLDKYLKYTFTGQTRHLQTTESHTEQLCLFSSSWIPLSHTAIIIANLPKYSLSRCIYVPT